MGAAGVATAAAAAGNDDPDEAAEQVTFDGHDTTTLASCFATVRDVATEVNTGTLLLKMEAMTTAARNASSEGRRIC